MKRFLCIGLICFFGSLYSQDTLSIYFEFSKSKLIKQDLDRYRSELELYQLSELDSIHFVGMADSIGDLKANIKLSEKRASYVQKELDLKVPFSIFSLGELDSDNQDLNRRVDVILFSPNQLITVEEKIDSVIIEDKRPTLCYNVDYQLLNTSMISKVKKRRAKFIQIESENLTLRKSKEHYYGTTSKNGDFVYKKIKWTERNTGQWWWGKLRSIALIPEKDFKRFKVFKLSSKPCNSCHEDFDNIKKIQKESKALLVDEFLMNNAQLKFKTFNRKEINIRVPKDYIDKRGKYFTSEDEKKIVWRTKGGGKNAFYYFSVLPVEKKRYISHVLKQMAIIEKDSSCVPDTTEMKRIECSTKSLSSNYLLSTDVGMYSPQRSLLPYFSGGIYRTGPQSQTSLYLGLDAQKSLFGSFNAQFNCMSFPISSINPFNVWRSPSGLVLKPSLAQFYIGTELLMKYKSKGVSFLDHNIHFGFSIVNANEKAIFHRFFIQYGFGVDYVGSRQFDKFTIMRTGIITNLRTLHF